jgi:hypothetical protein
MSLPIGLSACSAVVCALTFYKQNSESQRSQRRAAEDAEQSLCGLPSRCPHLRAI